MLWLKGDLLLCISKSKKMCWLLCTMKLIPHMINLTNFLLLVSNLLIIQGPPGAPGRDGLKVRIAYINFPHTVCASLCVCVCVWNYTVHCPLVSTLIIQWCKWYTTNTVSPIMTIIVNILDTLMSLNRTICSWFIWIWCTAVWTALTKLFLESGLICIVPHLQGDRGAPGLRGPPVSELIFVIPYFIF